MSWWQPILEWCAEASHVLVTTLLLQTMVGTLAVAAVWAASRALRRCHPKVLAGVWLIVFVRLVLPADLGLPIGGVSLMATIADSMSQVVVGGAEGLASGSDRDQASGVVPSGSGTDQQPSRWPLAAAGFWLLGAVRASWRWRRVRSGVRRAFDGAVELRDPEVQFLVAKWARRLAIRRRVRVVSGPQRVAPCVAGWWRPRIFVPRELVAEPAALECALAHELAHVARHDVLAMALEHVCQILYFFNPVVWWASSRLVHERERACDRLVVDRGDIQHLDYAHRLLNILECGYPVAPVAAVNARTRRMSVRIKSIIDARCQTEIGTMKSFLLVVAVALMVAPVAATVSGAGAASDPVSLQEQAMPASPGSASAVVEMIDPLPAARVSASYGDWRDPFTKKKAFHRGMDLAAPKGSDIVAPADATVEVATAEYEKQPASGTVVVLDHGDGVKTFFSHLGELRVAEGDTVRRGQVIGTVGMTGKTTGPHLHLEVWQNGEHQNPATYLTTR